jgi:hypothetical protein
MQCCEQGCGSGYGSATLVANPGSGAFLTLDPGYGIGFFRILHLGSQTHIFDSSMTNFWVKSAIILSVLAKKNSLYLFKNIIIYNFIILVAA